MTDNRWLLKIESSWGRDWRQVWSAFAEAGGLVCRHPMAYTFPFVILILLKLAWKAVDLHQLEGWRLYLTANVAGYSLVFLRFCVLGLIFAASTDRLRGKRRGLPGDALRRLGRMLPLGLALFILWEGVGGLLGYGLFEFAGVFMDAERAGWVLEAALLIGWLPGMIAAAMFGFAMVGAAAGDRVSLAQARALWRLAPRPLVYTFLLWYAVLQIPYCVTRFLFSGEVLHAFDPNWLYLVNRPLFTVLFGAVAAVWFVRLGARGVAMTPGGTKQARTGR